MQLRQLRAVADVGSCDSGDATDVDALLRHGCCSPHGVLHAAGTVDRGLLVDADADRFLQMYATKAAASWFVHEAMAGVPLMANILFSSVGAGIGNVGQGNYATANACLDAHAYAWRANGKAVCSLQWPLVGGAGMGAAAFAMVQRREMAAIAGLLGISLEEYAKVLRVQLDSLECNTLSVQLAHRSNVCEVLQDLADASQPRFGELAATLSSESAAAVAPSFEALSELAAMRAESLASMSLAERRAHLESSVLRVLHDLMGERSEALTADTPFADANVDSLAATELASRLQMHTSIALSPVQVLDLSTPRQLALHLLDAVDHAPASVSSLPHRLTDDWTEAVCMTPSGSRATILCPPCRPLKSRILFLHGQGTSASIARTLLEMRGWFDKLPFEFVIPDGTHEVEAWTDDDALKNLGLEGLHRAGLYDTSEPQRMWAARFDRFIDDYARAKNLAFWDESGRMMILMPDGDKRYLDEVVKERGGVSSPQMWEQTVQYLQRVIREHGPFDGIGGFSEGAATAHNLLCLQASGVDVGLGGIKLCLAFSPWISPMTTDLLDKLDVRLLLTSGREDSIMFHHALPRYASYFRDHFQYNFRGEHVYPPAPAELRRLCLDLVAAAPTAPLRSNIFGLEFGNASSPHLLCLANTGTATDKRPLFAIPGAAGHAERYNALASVVSNPVYGVAHPFLHTHDQADLATTLKHITSMWAHIILTECGERMLNPKVGFESTPTYHLIGSGIGGLLAHRVSVYAKQAGGSPCSLVLIDPVVPIGCAGRSVTVQHAAIYLALHSLGSDDLSFLEEPDYDTGVNKLCTDDELGLRLAARASDLGQTAFTVRAVVERQRELRVAIHMLDAVKDHSRWWLGKYGDKNPKQGLSQGGQLDLWLVRTSECDHHSQVGLTPGFEASAQRLWTVFGHPCEELMMMGTHLKVVLQCLAGTEEAFNMMLNRALGGKVLSPGVLLPYLGL